jgi:Leucine-rich repeat (LRR) protein
MKKDMDFIRQLEKETGSSLKEGEFDELLESKQNGYTIDEQGAVTGLCLFEVVLETLADTVLSFKNLHQLVLSGVDVKARDFSLLRQMISLTLLDLSSNGIDDISFLSGLKHIDQLYLGSNRIADISPLENLVHLTTLDLQKNQLTRIGNLETLHSLKIVNLQDNKVPDISPLQGLSRIVYLNITGNNILDIFPLQRMSQLAYLDAANNQIENISILSRLPGLNYLNLAGNKLTDISAIRGLTGLTVLKLANNNINSIFSIIELRNLTVLDLEKNKISDLTALRGLSNLLELRLGVNQITDLTPLSALTKLKVLNINENEITDHTPLNTLTKLEKLNLFENQITDLTPLRELTNLTDLDLGINEITDLTPLRALTKLIVLKLGSNEITDLMPLRELTNLTDLDLCINRITDLTPLSALTKLTVLVLVDNQISELTPLNALKNLKELWLSGNQITDLTPLIALTNLKELWLYNNQITDLTPLHTLTNLTKLDLLNNQITDLTPLRELKYLKHLDVRYNRIERLPPDITTWWPGMEMKWEDAYYIEGLNFYGNPLTDLPVEIVRQGKAAVINYFDEIQKASVLFLESKLLLVGSGYVGKTTLMKKLKDNDFVVVPGKEDTTHGIDIQPWQLSCPFPDGQTRDVKIHFWDFGGQDILHTTHQFFLTKRSLYLFVWDPRKEEETRSFDYWLNAVKILGAGSPLIMVMNKSDMRIKHIDEASFKDKFPNIAQFLQVSCLTDQHIPELTETIRTALSRMPHLLDKLPKRWMDIRDELKAKQDNYITQEDYFAVCLSHQMEKENALFLSDYLHDLGIILHFRQDPVLADTVILKPEWATDAVYALIDSLETQNNKGRFNRADLGRYWNQGIYPADKHTQLLRLIEKFELCFNIMGTDDYIIPELLPSQHPDIDREAYRSRDNLRLDYSYDFMPAGIITRFISRLHYLIRADHYWNNGVELEFSGSSALVVSDSAQKRIRVSVSGSNNTQLMGVIRSHFNHIHKTLNMKKEEYVFEEVPCICSQCQKSEKPHFFKYDVLLRLAEKGKEARCDKSLDDISTDKLLKGFLLPRIPGNLFDPLITTLAQVQGLKKTLQTDENSRNTVVALMLGIRGLHVKEQTLWAVSASGERIGELDIKIENETGRAVSIIEALNLDKYNTTKIDRHVRKLFLNYDCSGLKENYIVVYASAKDFEELCRKYLEHLEQIDYESYTLMKNGIEEVLTGFNKIAAYRARHRCNKGETVIYHILVDM